MPNLAFPFEVKTLNEEAGTFTGLCSVYDNLDATGDIVERGAFDITLRQQGKVRPLLFSHNASEIIGSVELADTPRGLEAKGQLVLAVARAREVLALMRARPPILRGLSIGYQSVRDEVKNGIRHLQAVRLYEVSLTPFPANELALVTGVKTIEEVRVALALAEFRNDIISALKGK